MSLGKRIRFLREGKGLRQEDMGHVLNVSKSAVSQWENDLRTPDTDMVVKLADYFNVSIDYLLGRPVAKNSSADPEGLQKGELITVEMVKIPVYRLDVEKEKVLAESNIVGWQYVPAEQMTSICFRVPDDSMSGSGIYTDYIVVVKRQTNAEDGQVVIVCTRDSSYNIRRIRFFDDIVLLDPDNPRYQSERTSINNLDIIGVVTNALFVVK